MGRKKKDPNEKPLPWERQPGEGPMAYKCFCAYRDSGAEGKRRSLTRTAQSLTKSDGTPYSDGTLKEWSRKHNWQERVALWDEEMDRQIREELVKGIATMRKNHADIAKQMLIKALKALDKIPAEELDAQDISRMVDTASKLERISRGEATERTEGKHTIAGDVRTESVLEVQNIDLSGLTDGELEKLDELVGKLAAE